MTPVPAGRRSGLAVSVTARAPGWRHRHPVRVRVGAAGLWSWQRRGRRAHLCPSAVAIGPGSLWIHLAGVGHCRTHTGARSRQPLRLTLWRPMVPGDHWRRLLVAARWSAQRGTAEGS